MQTRSKIAFASLLVLLGPLFCCCELWAQQISDPKSKSVSLGLLLEDSLMVEARYGAEFAVEEINRKGGLDGRPIALSVKSMEGPWGVGSKQAVDLVFDQEVWALIGALKGRNSHLVEQVAAKTDVPFVSAWAADPTLSKSYVPQFFNCVPNSEQQARAILAEMIENRGFDKWILVSDQDYDSRIAVESLLKMDACKKSPPSKQIKCNSSDDFETLIETIKEEKPTALILFCEPELNLELILKLRSYPELIPVYTSLSLLHEQTFSRLVSNRFEEVYFVESGKWMTQRDSDFVRRFKDEFGRDPGAMAAYGYDAIQIVARAIENSGSDPKKLKQSLSKSSYSGRTGFVEFDRLGNRKSILPLDVVSSEVLYLSKP